MLQRALDAAVRRCAAGWRPVGCRMCWRSRLPSRCRRGVGRARRRRRRGWPSVSGRRAGCAAVPAMGQGPPLVRVEPPAARRHWRAGRMGPLAAAAPQPAHRELAYYVCADPAGLPLIALVQVAGARWRVEQALAGRQGAVRPGPAPGPPLALLVPLGDAGLCVPGGGRGHRARPASGSTRDDRVELQRGPAPASRPWSAVLPVMTCTGCAGHGGDAASKPALAPATTNDKPPSSHEDHDLRLED
jgi:hypothetical protein